MASRRHRWDETPYFVVGDIHGCSGQLRLLLQHEELYRGRRAIFLGDFIDIGPDSSGVLDLLIDLRERFQDSVFLEGNHEYGLLEYLNSGDFASYAAAGGIATIRSYCGEIHGDVRNVLQRSIPRAHLDFLRKLHVFYESDNCLFSHCGYDPRVPADRSRKTMVLESHQDLFTSDSLALRKQAVFGHYYQRTKQPHIREGIICLDTGCGALGGPLTALLLPEGQVIQATSAMTLDYVPSNVIRPSLPSS